MALKCQAKDCVYNENNGECFANTVMIGNKNALTTSGTTCNSYVPNNQVELYELADDFLEPSTNASDVRNISCSATNCKYNHNQDCVATKVKINDQNASCETFAP